MTDYDKLKTTFEEIGIPFKINKQPLSIKYEDNDNMEIMLEAGYGYADFITLFNFDKNGNFIEHGIME